jgi:2-oxoisovalerate dehydrogenase E1 component
MADGHAQVFSAALSPSAMPGAEAAPRAFLELARFPDRLSREALYPLAYLFMYLSRRLEERIFDLFQKGQVKGTVTISIGNEATAVGMSLPFRPGKDIVSLLHRDFSAHLVSGATPRQMLSQYLANAESSTHGREGNVHHGDAGRRRFPMISHLGKMLSVAVGGTWAARRNGEEVFGLATIGDGGTSTGEFHEAVNLASVLKVPVLFLIENNQYAFSTPAAAQYHCRHLSDRASGYGIAGRTIDGTDVGEVYDAVYDALEAMRGDSMPAVIECMSLRIHGHAAYDKGAYVDPAQREAALRRDPLPNTRQRLIHEFGLSEIDVAAMEHEAETEIEAALAESLRAARPAPPVHGWRVYSAAAARFAKPFKAEKVKNGDAVRLAQEYLLENNPRAFLAGLDVGVYGSAFKTCKGLHDRFGSARVIDMPMAESGIMGFALGASQTGAEPIVEFQFADFSTEATGQLGLNAGTWYFRAGREAPLLVRLPCGGGLTMGAFHSGEFEGLWSRFPGLKLLYPATAQETFEALVAGFYDRNPCLVFEHKLLYWSKNGDIDFDGDLRAVWHPRRYREGTELTVVAFGAMVYEAIAAADASGRLLVVQECGAAQGLGDRIISLVARQIAPQGLKAAPQLLAAPDAPVPFAAELESQFRPDRVRILAAIERLLEGAARQGTFPLAGMAGLGLGLPLPDACGHGGA